MGFQGYRTWVALEALPAAQLNEQVRDNGNELIKGGCTIVFDGGGVPLTTNSRISLPETPYKLTIDSVILSSTDTGDLVVDIWVPVASSNPGADSDSICSATPPTLSCDSYSKDTTLSGWTPTIAEGKRIDFYIESCLVITKASLGLTWVRSS